MPATRQEVEALVGEISHRLVWALPVTLVRQLGLRGPFDWVVYLYQDGDIVSYDVVAGGDVDVLMDQELGEEVRIAGVIVAPVQLWKRVFPGDGPGLPWSEHVERRYVDRSFQTWEELLDALVAMDAYLAEREAQVLLAEREADA